MLDREFLIGVVMLRVWDGVLTLLPSWVGGSGNPGNLRVGAFSAQSANIKRCAPPRESGSRQDSITEGLAPGGNQFLHSSRTRASFLQRLMPATAVWPPMVFELSRHRQQG